MARDSVAFLADGHLLWHDEERIQTLVDKLEELGERCAAIYILGDLFEVWLGVDASLPSVERVATTLKGLRARGVRTAYVEGNRDFRIGHGATDGLFDVIAPVELSEQFGETTFHMSHGDLVNTADRQYRAWRAFAKNVLAPVALRILPDRACLGVANRLESRLRTTNRRHKSYFPEALCLEHARTQIAAGADVVLVGHFHYHFVRRVEAGDRTGTFISLPFWHDEPKPIVFDFRGEILGDT